MGERFLAIVQTASLPGMVVRWLLEYEAVNWNASGFWVDRGCRGNHAHGKREAYGSIGDGAAVMRVQFRRSVTPAAIQMCVPAGSPIIRANTRSLYAVPPRLRSLPREESLWRA